MAKKYEKERLIGTGTFGQVWLVTRRNCDKKYVMKKLQLTSMSCYEKRQALNEITILSKCRHANIIRYKEAVINYESGELGIIMEFAQGGDLYTRIKLQEGCYFLEETICLWFVQICLALQYIHNHNILHRDLKTQNILLTAKGRIKVGDFGISRLLDRHEDLATTAIGTPYYLSPEICQRKPYNQKSDVWSLGCVLYELCVLDYPFHGHTFDQLVTSILKGKYRPIPSHYSFLLQDLLAVMLQVDPNNRPSSDELLTIPTLQPYLRKYFSQENDKSSLDSSSASPKIEMTPPRRQGEKKRRASSVSAWNKGQSKPKQDEMTKKYLLDLNYEEVVNKQSGLSNSGNEAIIRHDKHSPGAKRTKHSQDWSTGTYIISAKDSCYESISKAETLCLNCIHCPHFTHCQECVLETLWNNRLKVQHRNCISNLQETLDGVFGSEEVTRLKTALVREWQSDTSPLQTILRSVRQDLVHYVPLLIQLVQLETVCEF